jgi:hypothetical protein
MIKPNEVISAFLEIAKELVCNFDGNTDIKERYNAIKFFDYCIDFLPHSAGYYVLPVGMRLGFVSGSSSPRMHGAIINILSRKMEYLKKRFEKLAFNIRYAKTQEEFRAISTELENLVEVMENEKYESLEELEYEPWGYFKRFSIFFDTNKLPGAFIVFLLNLILFLIVQFMPRLITFD